MGALVGLAAVVVVTGKLKSVSGTRFLGYACVFSAMRLLILPLRALTYPSVIKNIIYPAVYILIIIAGVAGMIALKKRADNN